MSRLFNGTSQAMSVALDLSGFAAVSVAFWLWWDTFANNDKLAAEYSPDYNSNKGFIIDPNNTAGVTGTFGFGFSRNNSGAGFWTDRFTRPSAAAWHHYVLTMDRANTVNTAYVDGAVPAGFATIQHTAGTAYGNYANSTLYLMCRNNASLFGAGRMAHAALWKGVVLTAREALALSSGASPMRIGPVPGHYWPLFGSSPEPDFGGTQKSLTLTATPTVVAHPPVMASAF